MLWDRRNSKHNKSQWKIIFPAKLKARKILSILGKRKAPKYKISSTFGMTEFNILKILGIKQLNARYISRIVAWSRSEREKNWGLRA